eukprot:15089441-Alexandrium_andersonii.AAC.1
MSKCATGPTPCGEARVRQVPVASPCDEARGARSSGEALDRAARAPAPAPARVPAGATGSLVPEEL